MIATPLTKVISTDPSELQSRNGQENQRVFDPSSYDVLTQILSELKAVRFHLQILTEVTDDDD